ncbi:MAG: PfkB family carbohydrate kinase [Acidobacteriota bacterium]
MSRTRLLVVGDVAWDIFIRPQRPLVSGSDVLGTVDMMPGGAAANVAVWARRLGADARLVGKVGDDPLGELMCAHLRAEAAAGDLICVAGGLTTRVGILVSADGEHSFVIDHTKILLFEEGDVPTSLLDGVDAVFFNGYDIYLAGSAAFLTPVLGEARRRHIPVAFDPSSFTLIEAYGAERLLGDVCPLDVLIANEDETRALAGGSGASALTAHASLVVVKRGRDGAAAYGNGVWTREPSTPLAAVDTTGAGDAFDAAFLVEWLESGDVDAALKAGNRLGAYVASHLGAQPAMAPPRV